MGEKDKLYSGELSALDIDFYSTSFYDSDLNANKTLDVDYITDTPKSCTALAKLWKWIFG